MKEFFNRIGDWFINHWQSIIVIIAIFTIGFLLVKIILALVKRRFAKTKIEKTAQSFILSVLKFVLYLILIVCILASLGISITGLTVVISAISLAISLALQDSLKNLVNGFIVISTKLIKEGDYVQVGGVEGSVVDIKMLYTVLRTPDCKKITIPNSSIIGSTVTNYNAFKLRRLDLNFSLSYDCNVDLAKQVIKDVLDSCEYVYNDPAPLIVISDLGESSITMLTRVYCSTTDYWNTKWYLIDNIFNELKRNKLTIPFKQLEVALVDPNKQAYVRENKLDKVLEHKTKATQEDDIIDTLNKSFKTNMAKLSKIKLKKKDNQNKK